MSDEIPASLRDFHVTVAANSAQLGPLRDAVTRFSQQAGAPTEVAESFELVVSELATNVMQHSASSTVTVAFDRLENGWQLDVSDADHLDLAAGAQLPAADQLAGRGLFIVEAVMDRVEQIKVGEHEVLRCIKYET